MMFYGQYAHTIDEKNRIIIPAKFREKLGLKVIVCLGYDGTLAIYSESGFEERLNSLRELSTTKSDIRALNRLIATTANECEFDKQGRIIIPPFLVKELNNTREVVITGVDNHVEIWIKAKWEEYYSNYKVRLEEISEKL